MGWRPRYYIPSFVQIGQAVLEKKNFEGFLPYMGVTQMSQTNFRSPYPRRLHIKFGFDWPCCLEEKMFEILDDGQTQDNG